MRNVLAIACVLAVPRLASAQFIPLELGPARLPALSLAPLGTSSCGLSLGELASLPELPTALPTRGLHAADPESSDPNAFKGNNAALQQVLDAVRADAWKGKGPGRYDLPGVTHLYIDTAGAGLPTLYVNAQPIGYLSGNASASAASLRDELRQGGNVPRAVVVEGHYANTVFYVDRIRFAD